MRAGQALAALREREYVLPDDIKIPGDPCACSSIDSQRRGTAAGKILRAFPGGDHPSDTSTCSYRLRNKHASAGSRCTNDLRYPTHIFFGGLFLFIALLHRERNLTIWALLVLGMVGAGKTLGKN